MRALRGHIFALAAKTMTNPLENQNNGMLHFRRFTKGNWRRAMSSLNVEWIVPQNSDYFWLMHNYYERMTLLDIIGKEARRGCCS